MTHCMNITIHQLFMQISSEKQNLKKKKNLTPSTQLLVSDTYRYIKETLLQKILISTSQLHIYKKISSKSGTKIKILGEKFLSQLLFQKK